MIMSLPPSQHLPVTTSFPASPYRVDFIAKGGSTLCGKQQIKIDRTFPTNIQSLQENSRSSSSSSNDYYSITNWEDFCNRIDSVLESLASLRKRNSRLACSLLALSAFLLAITPVITKIWLGDVLGNFWYVAMFVILTIPLFGSCYLVNSANTRDQQIVQDLYNVCREETERIALGPQFYLRRERVYRQDAKSVGLVKYIEVVVIPYNYDDGDTNNNRTTRMNRPRTPDTVVSSDEAVSSSIGVSGHDSLQRELDNMSSLHDHRSGGDGGPIEFISTFDRLRALGTSRGNLDPSHRV